MISAVITSLDDAGRLTATLASLAPAAIDGLVREAVVVDVGAGEAVLAAAEDAGARVVSAAAGEGLAAACAAARGPWLLILPSGARLQVGWEAAARRHIERHADKAGWFALSLDADGPGARLAEAAASIAAAWLGRPQPRQGLLISKAAYERVLARARAAEHARLVRALGGRGLRGLGSRVLS
jgi:hypothetical protein